MCKNLVQPDRTQITKRMRLICCIIKARHTHTHTHRMCSITYCLSTATMVRRKPLNNHSILRYTCVTCLGLSYAGLGAMSKESYVLPNTPKKEINIFCGRRKRMYIHKVGRTRSKNIFLTSDRKRQFVTHSSQFPRGNLHPFAR
jgi:hypothetical protein